MPRTSTTTRPHDQARDQDLDEPIDDASSVSLFEGDEGGLEYSQRHALVTLLKQRFISGRPHPREWAVLVEHERVLRSRLNDMLAKHTGQSLERIEKDTDRDNFMSATAAVEYGLVDKVLTSRDDT